MLCCDGCTYANNHASVALRGMQVVHVLCTLLTALADISAHTHVVPDVSAALCKSTCLFMSNILVGIVNTRDETRQAQRQQ